MMDGPALEAEDAELLVATCIMRTLPPALTLQHGLDEIKAAVEELKSNPPFATSGMYRFQVFLRLYFGFSVVNLTELDVLC